MLYFFFFFLTKPISSAIFQISCFYLVGMEVGRGTERGNSERRACMHDVTAAAPPARPLLCHEAESQSRRSAHQQTGWPWNAEEYFLFHFLFLVSRRRFLSSAVLSRQRTSHPGGNLRSIFSGGGFCECKTCLYTSGMFIRRGIW